MGKLYELLSSLVNDKPEKKPAKEENSNKLFGLTLVPGTKVNDKPDDASAKEAEKIKKQKQREEWAEAYNTNSASGSGNISSTATPTPIKDENGGTVVESGEDLGLENTIKEGGLTDGGKLPSENVKTPTVESGDLKNVETEPIPPTTTNAETEGDDGTSFYNNYLNAERQKKFRNSTKSIWDAYLDGDFGEGADAKKTRDYLLMDAVANFAGKMSDHFNAIGAAYGNTTYKPQHADDKTMWEKRRDKIFENEIEGDSENVTGSPAWRKRAAELMSLDSQSLDNKIKQIQSKFTEDQLRTALATQAAQLGMMKAQQKILNRQLKLSDVFEAMGNKSNSQLAQIGFYTLSGLTLDGGKSLLGSVGNKVGF